MKRIAIVGGGPGGLITSFLLQQKSAEPLKMTLFEADTRLGGKVLTERFSSVPVPYEAGAAEFYKYGEADPLWLLIDRELGLQTIRMYGSVVRDGEEVLHDGQDLKQRLGKSELKDLCMFGSTVVLGNKIIRNKHNVIRHFGKRTWKALREFHRKACDARSLADFYDSGWPADNRHPWAKRSWGSILDRVADADARYYLETLCHSDLATEPHLTNGLYGLDNYLMNDERYCSLYWIDGGMERLIDALAERCQANIELNSPVKAISRTAAGKYRVTWQQVGELHSGEFDAVIVALPNYWLPRIDWQGTLLSKAMRHHHAYYDYPAHYLRINVLFERPFWREHISESFFLHDALGGCCVYDEASRHDTGTYGVLGWLLGGNSALVMNNVDDAELIECATGSLPEQMGRGRDHLIEGNVHRWIGTACARPGGKVIKGSKKRHRPEQLRHPGLFVVGDYLFDSTINGLFDSAEIVSTLSLDHLKIPKTTLDPEYFDYYDDKSPYGDSFKVAFDAKYVTRLIQTVWGRSAPYKLLDVGSANGLTIPALAKLGVEVWGIENNRYIHAQTPAELLNRNQLGDVCEMPFEDNFFDFAYETCLAHVPPSKLETALKELYRVTKYGVFLGTVVKDFQPKIVKKYDLFYGTNSLLTLKEWSDLFLRNGFRLAASDPMLSRLWKIERKACKGETWYPTRESMQYCFYSKINGMPGEPSSFAKSPEVAPAICHHVTNPPPGSVEADGS